MKKQPTQLIKFAILTAIVCVAVFSLLLLAGEENPNNPTPFSQIIFIKVIALGVLLACVWVGKVCNKKGLLPDIKED